MSSTPAADFLVERGSQNGPGRSSVLSLRASTGLPKNVDREHAKPDQASQLAVVKNAVFHLPILTT